MRKSFIYFFLGVFGAFVVFSTDSFAVSRVIPSGSSVAGGETQNSRNSGDKPVISRVTSVRNSAPANAETTAVRSGSRVVNMPGATLPSNNEASVSHRGVSSRQVRQPLTFDSGRSGLDAAVNTVGRNPRVKAASINSNPAVRRAGLVLRPTVAEVGGRAKIAGTDMQTGSNIKDEIRNISARATSKAPSGESIEEIKTRLEQVSTINKSCQEQYNDCMDQFCAVIDANQKRCSCSENLQNYVKTEKAVKDANVQLNEVAQRIRYVGLSADEIRAIMNATEAEAALSGQTDTTETRNMLKDIEKLIKDPNSSTYSSSESFAGLDIDLDFSADEGDLFNLDFLTGSNDSFAKLRGKELYNAAKKRCAYVLNQCKDIGANDKQLMGNYDMLVDKDCIAYENGLRKMNETLLSNVRSANRMLQKARLAVLQNNNVYDAKACVAALDECMRDDMVCGDDYVKCLDPTKRYIDENGKVVLGQNITDITAFMKNYDNAAIDSAFLGKANGITISIGGCKPDTDNPEHGGDGSCNVKYLLSKVGTGEKVTDNGLCRAVLDKCKAYTYDKDGKYIAYNDIVVNYIQRAMVNIKAAQQQIISDYASSCMVDVASCYNKQVNQINTWSSGAGIDSIYNVMRGACRNVALTCAYAVFANDDESCPRRTVESPPETGTNPESTCIENISQMFYQSLLCPDNSTYTSDECINTPAGEHVCVNKHCKCTEGYEVWSDQCLLQCPSDSGSDNSLGMIHNSWSGACECPTNSYEVPGAPCKCKEGYEVVVSEGGNKKYCREGQTNS